MFQKHTIVFFNTLKPIEKNFVKRYNVNMDGLLIVNAYLCGKKYDGIYDMLTEAANKRDVGLKIIGNDEILATVGNRESISADFVLFWDKDVKLAEFLERKGVRVFNGSRAIAVCDDKALTAIALSDKGIAMPETVIAPMTFENIGYTDYGFVQKAGEKLGYPLVMKECFGSFGHEVYLMSSYDELLNKVKSIGSKPMLFQKLVKSSFGRDIRVQVVGHNVVAAVRREAKAGSLIANVTSGGKMYPYTLTPQEEKLAVDTSKALNLDFAGIDLLFGENGPLLCEVNTNAHFKNLYDATGINVADSIIDYVIKNI